MGARVFLPFLFALAFLKNKFIYLFTFICRILVVHIWTQMHIRSRIQFRSERSRKVPQPDFYKMYFFAFFLFRCVSSKHKGHRTVNLTYMLQVRCCVQLSITVRLIMLLKAYRNSHTRLHNENTVGRKKNTFESHLHKELEHLMDTQKQNITITKIYSNACTTNSARAFCRLNLLHDYTRQHTHHI